MKLYLLRHGIAEERDAKEYPDDSARPLTSEGKRRTKLFGRWLRRRVVRFDAILSSELLRARQTADIVASVLRFPERLVRLPELAPEGDVRKLVKAVATRWPTAKKLLIVGHEPQLGELFSYLCTGRPNTLEITFKKGGLCRLDVDTLRAGRCARLDWMLAPSLMKSKR